jgi:hypothetical protein
LKSLTLVIVLLLSFGLIGVLAGCIDYPSQKTTGGGWFTDNITGNKVNFGFNAQPIDETEAKGKFQLVDSANKVRIHGTLDTTLEVTSPDVSAHFQGTCSINGEGSYNLTAYFIDIGEPGITAGDAIGIEIGTEPPTLYFGWIGGGNIQIHRGRID